MPVTQHAEAENEEEFPTTESRARRRSAGFWGRSSSRNTKLLVVRSGWLRRNRLKLPPQMNIRRPQQAREVAKAWPPCQRPRAQPWAAGRAVAARKRSGASEPKTARSLYAEAKRQHIKGHDPDGTPAELAAALGTR